jgi:hypothetical protein
MIIVNTIVLKHNRSQKMKYKNTETEQEQTYDEVKRELAELKGNSNAFNEYDLDSFISEFYKVVEEE